MLINLVKAFHTDVCRMMKFSAEVMKVGRNSKDKIKKQNFKNGCLTQKHKLNELRQINESDSY